MRNIYLFNPENDLAIAHGKKRYDAPKSARRLASDMSLLPLWYAQNDSNSLIITQSSVPSDYQKELFEALHIGAKLVSENEYIYHSDDVFHPWGWSLALKDRLERWAGGDVVTPDLSTYRRLSGRQFAVFVLKELRSLNRLDGSVLIPIVGASLPKLAEATLEFGNPCLMKAPWSGSGKGLLWAYDGWTERVSAWCNNILKRQGEVVCEPCYAKVQDFAMEFRIQNSQLSFVGYSYFQTDDSGTYRGNLLASDAHIEQLLSSWLPVEVLHETCAALLEILSLHLAPYYEGFFGIDMMVCEKEGRYFLHPCVELNLRFNMGLVSHALYENYVHPSSVGRYVVMHGRNSEELRSFSLQMQQEHPLEMADAKVAKGFFPLTYVGDESEYMAYCIVE